MISTDTAQVDTTAAKMATIYITNGPFAIAQAWPTETAGDDADKARVEKLCWCLGPWKKKCASPGKHPRKSGWQLPVDTAYPDLDRDGKEQTWDDGTVKMIRGQTFLPGQLADISYAQRLWLLDQGRRGILCNLDQSDLGMLDFDSAEAIERFQAGPFGRLVEKACSVRSGRREIGLHLYFKQTAGMRPLGSIPQSAFRRAYGLEKIEFKGAGGLSILPPTMHWTGSRYRFINACKPAEMPLDLREWLEQASAQGGGGSRSGEHQDGTGDLSWIKWPEQWTSFWYRRFRDELDGSRNITATTTAYQFRDVARIGTFTPEVLEDLFYDAAFKNVGKVMEGCQHHKWVGGVQLKCSLVPPGEVACRGCPDDAARVHGIWSRLGAR